MTDTTSSTNPSPEIWLDLAVVALALNGVLVFFMQAGFAFLEAGAVRARNATQLLLKTVLNR